MSDPVLRPARARARPSRRSDLRIERGKDSGERRLRAGLVVAVLILAAALLFTLGHRLHWPVAVHGVILIALLAVAAALLFTARGPSSRTAGGGGDIRRRQGSGRGS